MTPGSKYLLLGRAELFSLAGSRFTVCTLEAMVKLENKLFMAHLYQMFFVLCMSTLNGIKAVT